jgi:hypothetical protein
MEGANDWDLAALSAERDYVIVTNNGRNFMRLYGRLEIHDGLIIIVPTVSSNEQVRLFEVALDIAGQQERSLVSRTASSTW